MVVTASPEVVQRVQRWLEAEGLVSFHEKYGYPSDGLLAEVGSVIRSAVAGGIKKAGVMAVHLEDESQVDDLEEFVLVNCGLLLLGDPRAPYALEMAARAWSKTRVIKGEAEKPKPKPPEKKKGLLR